MLDGGLAAEPLWRVACNWCRVDADGDIGVPDWDVGFIQNSKLLIHNSQPVSGLCGEAVFLQAAIGFVGNGAFDEGCSEGGFEVASFKVFAPAQGQCCLDF